MKLQEFFNLTARVAAQLPPDAGADEAVLKRLAPLFQNGLGCTNCAHGNIVNGVAYCKTGNCKDFNNFEPKGSID